jgi:SWI/SNF related-matrix-associated actin-dependent regulator of chromatin subfamily C
MLNFKVSHSTVLVVNLVSLFYSLLKVNWASELKQIITLSSTGWFSWKEIHPVEKQTLPSFFNGKSEKRTPEVYLAVRNSIMMKFHANPQLQLESKDLAELSIGETDARQEILEFLDHWGLINFHPFPPDGHEESKPEETQDNSNDEKASLIEQLFKFESVQSYMTPLPMKEDVRAPPPLPSLIPESVLIQDVVAAAEPSVEYHCNSCSVDCSRKRYHCRTQVWIFDSVL